MAKEAAFTTKFILDAVWKGAAGFKAADRSIEQTEKQFKGLIATTKEAHIKLSTIGKAVAGAASAFLAFRAVQKTIDIMKEAFDAGLDVAEVHEKIGLALERNKARYNMTGKSLDAAREKLIKVAEQMEKTGFDAEDLEAGFAKLTASMSPSDIAKYAQGYSDLVAKLAGPKASVEEMETISLQINKAIKSGNPVLLRRLNYSKAELKEFRGLKTIAERRAWVEKNALKVTGETGRQFSTIAGIRRQAEIQKGNVFETIGKMDPEKIKAIAENYRQMWISVGLLAEKADIPWFTDKFFVSVKETSDQAINLIDKVFNADTYKIAWQGFVASLRGYWDEAWLKFDVNFKIPFEKWWSGIAGWLAGPLNEVWTAITDKFKAIWEKVMEYVPDWMKGGTTAPAAATAAPAPGQFKAWETALPSTGYGGTAVQKPEIKAQDTWTPGPGIPARPSGAQAAPAPVPAPQVTAAQTASTGGGSSTGSGAVRGKEVTAGNEAVGTVDPNADIAAERARVMKQMQEPGMRELVAATISHEQGGAEGRGDVLESLVNRAVVTGKHPRDLITGGGRTGSFYGPYRRGEVQRTLAKGVPESVLSQFDQLATQVGAGRNAIGGRIDQGMMDAKHREIDERFGKAYKVRGEFYGFKGLKGEKDTAAYRSSLGGNINAISSKKRMEQAVNNGQNVTYNPTVNVSGADLGQARANANAVVRAMQDPTKQLLTQLKEAREQESRLGYV